MLALAKGQDPPPHGMCKMLIELKIADGLACLPTFIPTRGEPARLLRAEGHEMEPDADHHQHEKHRHQ